MSDIIDSDVFVWFCVGLFVVSIVGFARAVIDYVRVVSKHGGKNGQ